ncbi:MAG: bifunctional adenosylcobinamide kinase/adenosylcobinamide-phosphate guanylyltransferase [Kiritimatiellia bacterium]|nr:bifunctional adenosylcobinamide kinase/adenosylcobinamide-phosphate guanylyltransferase [Kiritimatiellia bacterium]
MDITRILVLGGARSGKSSYALKLSESNWCRPLYVATAEASDIEMQERIAAHKKARGKRWACAEEPLEIAHLVRRADKLYPARDVLLIDCFTLWLNNVLLNEDLKSFERRRVALLKAVRASKKSLIMVSNEVGLGIVPENESGRQFRDLAGWLNQDLAAVADTVVFIAAGLPLIMKGTLPENL